MYESKSAQLELIAVCTIQRAVRARQQRRRQQREAGRCTVAAHVLQRYARKFLAHLDRLTGVVDLRLHIFTLALQRSMTQVGRRRSYHSIKDGTPGDARATMARSQAHGVLTPDSSLAATPDSVPLRVRFACSGPFRGGLRTPCSRLAQRRHSMSAASPLTPTPKSARPLLAGQQEYLIGRMRGAVVCWLHPSVNFALRCWRSHTTQFLGLQSALRRTLVHRRSSMLWCGFYALSRCLRQVGMLARHQSSCRMLAYCWVLTRWRAMLAARRRRARQNEAVAACAASGCREQVREAWLSLASIARHRRLASHNDRLARIIGDGRACERAFERWQDVVLRARTGGVLLRRGALRWAAVVRSATLHYWRRLTNDVDWRRRAQAAADAWQRAAVFGDSAALRSRLACWKGEAIRLGHLAPATEARVKLTSWMRRRHALRVICSVGRARRSAMWTTATAARFVRSRSSFAFLVRLRVVAQCQLALCHAEQWCRRTQMRRVLLRLWAQDIAAEASVRARWRVSRSRWRWWASRVAIERWVEATEARLRDRVLRLRAERALVARESFQRMHALRQLVIGGSWRRVVVEMRARVRHDQLCQATHRWHSWASDAGLLYSARSYWQRQQGKHALAKWSHSVALLRRYAWSRRRLMHIVRLRRLHGAVLRWNRTAALQAPYMAPTRQGMRRGGLQRGAQHAVMASRITHSSGAMQTLRSLHRVQHGGVRRQRDALELARGSDAEWMRWAELPRRHRRVHRPVASSMNAFGTGGSRSVPLFSEHAALCHCWQQWCRATPACLQTTVGVAKECVRFSVLRRCRRQWRRHAAELARKMGDMAHAIEHERMCWWRRWCTRMDAHAARAGLVRAADVRALAIALRHLSLAVAREQARQSEYEQRFDLVCRWRLRAILNRWRSRGAGAVAAVCLCSDGLKWFRRRCELRALCMWRAIVAEAAHSRRELHCIVHAHEARVRDRELRVRLARWRCLCSESIRCARVRSALTAATRSTRRVAFRRWRFVCLRWWLACQLRGIGLAASRHLMARRALQSWRTGAAYRRAQLAGRASVQAHLRALWSGDPTLARALEVVTAENMLVP